MKLSFRIKQFFCKHEMVVKKEHLHISYSNKAHFNGYLQTETCQKCGYIKVKKIPRNS